MTIYLRLPFLFSLCMSLGMNAFVSAQVTPATVAPSNKESSKQSRGVQLGITVSKPGAAVYAQLPSLPRGSGFLLQSVTTGGSADAAGLKPMDLIWKLGDQILINENQLMVLLSQYQPGDKVQVSYFHAGLEKTTTMLLKSGNRKPDAPAGVAMSPPFPGAPGYGSNPAQPSFPMRVISYEDRSASISDSHGTATLTYREGKPWLHVESKRGIETFNDFVSKAEDVARVPLVWRSRLPILQRSLEESIRLRKLPRVRRVPTPKQRIAVGQ
ncbi:MAG: PDZ domain-containing protein [Akkermansiaceae bacterium]|nr:PDZ domain-containing protein [Akkermansiaceae bacterium]